MKVLIVFAHPEHQSFNGKLFHAAVEAFEDTPHSVQTSDLYKMGFDPVSDRRNFNSIHDLIFFKQQLEELHATKVDGFNQDLEEEIQKLEACDLMIWQFPLWWFSLPGILKGWVDKVFVMGRTYDKDKTYDQGLFKEKRALISLTTGSPKEAYTKEGKNGEIHSILRPIQRGILEFVGFKVLSPHLVYSASRLSEEEQTTLLLNYQERLKGIETESPIEVGTF